MKFEIEVLDSDLKDREILVEMQALIEEKMGQLSEFSKNNLGNEWNFLRGALENVENGWLKWQRERALNKLSEALNVERKKFVTMDWNDY
jgi:hypothetical protein